MTVEDHLNRLRMEICLSTEGRDAECLPVEESYNMAIQAIEDGRNAGIVTADPWLLRLLVGFKK